MADSPSRKTPASPLKKAPASPSGKSQASPVRRTIAKKKTLSSLPALADKSRRISTEGKKQISIVFDGKELKLSPDQEIRFSTTNPKKRGSICFQRYQKYRRATKVAQALKFGCSMSDLKWDISRGHAEIVGKESLVKEVLPKVKKVRVKKAQGEGKARTTRTKRGAADDKGKTAKGANAGKKRDGKKYITKDGLIALNRKFSDPKSWASRRQPQTPPPGGWPTPPAHWPAGVRVDVGKPVYWLPEGWGQGVKTTCAAMLKCYVSPEGKMYYHRHVVEQIVGESLGKPDNPEAAIKWAKSYAQDRIADKTMWDRQPPKVDDPKKLYAQLSKKERSFLPKSADEIYWAVVSARRATDERGLKLIANVQVMLTVAGAKPVWYVDEASVAAYRALGLNAKVGGKLVPARNMALDDAAKAKKPCVQISDDIMHWDYLDGDLEKITGAASNPYCTEMTLFKEWQKVGQRDQALALAREEMDLQLLLREDELHQQNATTVGKTDSPAAHDGEDTTVPTTEPLVDKEKQASARKGMSDIQAVAASLTDKSATWGDLKKLAAASNELIELPHPTTDYSKSRPEMEELKESFGDFENNLMSNFTDIVARLAARAKAFREQANSWKTERDNKKGKKGASATATTEWGRSLEKSMAEMEARKQKLLQKKAEKGDDNLGTKISNLHLELCLEPHRWSYPSCAKVLEENGFKVVEGQLTLDGESADDVDDEEEEGDWSKKIEESRVKLCEDPEHQGFPECSDAATTSTQEEQDDSAEATGALRGQAARISWKSAKYWAAKWWGGSQPMSVAKADLAHVHWSGMLPKVVCVAVVPSDRSARYRLKYFVNAFRLQTYEGPHELVLVYHSEDEQAAHLVKRFADGAYIRGVAAQGNETLPSTTAYRFGAWAVGQPGLEGQAPDAPDVIAQWDFEAWHHPDRLRMQVRSLGVGGRPVSILFPDSEAAAEMARRSNTSFTKFSEGSMVGEAEWMRRHWYPLLEEGSSVLDGKEAARVVKVTMPELMVYSNSSSV